MKYSDQERIAAERDRALFDQIAEKYALKDLAEASRIARRQRILATLRLVPASSHGRILEVGCGAGFASEYLRGLYGAYVGIDYSQELIRIARRHHESPAVRFLSANALDFFDNEGFDLILMVGVLHHIPDWESVVRHLSQLLVPGGWLAANEPQPSNPLVQGARRIRRWVDESYSKDQAELSATEIVGAFRGAGLRDIRYSGQGVFSTPFAEVVIFPRPVARLVSRAAVSFDCWFENRWPAATCALAWNTAVAGTR